MQSSAYSGALRRTLDTLRPDFSRFSDAFGLLSVKRATFAPLFMRAFDAYERETGKTFVAFVQEFDRSVPAERAKYTQHRSYQAALYLRRLVDAPETAAGVSRRSVTPFQLLAVTIKSLLPLAHPHEQAAFEIIAKASKWRERDVEKLRKRVARVRALPLPNAPRLRVVPKIEPLSAAS